MIYLVGGWHTIDLEAMTGFNMNWKTFGIPDSGRSTYLGGYQIATENTYDLFFTKCK